MLCQFTIGAWTLRDPEPAIVTLVLRRQKTRMAQFIGRSCGTQEKLGQWLVLSHMFGAP